MVIDSQKLAAFFEVAQVKNFSLAARNLFVTQSALSQRVAKLEEELGVNLFIRSGKEFHLSTSGTELLRYAQIQRGMEEELLSKIGVTKNRGFGVVRIAGYSSVVRSAIIPALGDLSKSDFKGQYEVLCKEVRELPPLLFSGAVDYIVTLEKVPRSDVEELVLGEEELVEIRPLKIKTEVYLDHEVDDTTTLDFFTRQGRPDFKFERAYVDDVYGIIDGVKNGLGNGIVSKHLVMGEKKLSVIRPRKRVSYKVYLYFMKRSYDTELHKRVVEHLISRVRLSLNRSP